MINPFWLRTFCTLVEVSHFTRTAEKLNMTQSGVSQQVRKLEEQIGTSLLLRQGKQFILTDAGDRLYQEGRELLKGLSELEKGLGEDPKFEGVVRVASPGSVGLKLYQQLLLLQQRHPKLIIHYRFAPNQEIEKLVAEHKIDLGFMTRLSSLKDVHIKPIGQEELLLVTPHTTHDASWDELQQLGFIDHPDGDYHVRLLIGANYSEFEEGKTFKKTGFSNQISLILEPVAMGIGFTVLPRHAVGAFNKPNRIRVHRLAEPVSETLYLCTHSQKHIPNRVKMVIEEAEKTLK